MNTTYKLSLTMDGCILKLSEGAMTYPKVEEYPTIICSHASTSKVILKLKQPQGYGNTPGVPSNFSLLVMTFELNGWGGNISTTFAKSSKNIMKYQKIGRETNLQALTWNGTMPPSTMTTPVASQSKDTLKSSLSYLFTSARPNLSSCSTSIVKFTLEPKYNCPQRKQLDQVLMLKA